MQSVSLIKSVVIGFAVAVILPLWAAASGAAGEKPATTPSLYERLGGADNIAVVTDEIIERAYASEVLHANPRIAEAHARFPKAAYKFKVTLLVCQATGGPYKYVGRTMKEAHRHLNVTETEWRELISIVRESLGKYKVPQKEQDEVIAGLEKTKGEIVVPSTASVADK
ncbi:MAG TPA: group 1 truncated hemoglobin [Geobacteraceae bacterium]|nr:group 1 truncated hemoglobin [Geobacteraceae bacterium]